MGTSQTKSIDDDKDVVYEKLVLTQQDIQKAELCPDKPLPGYAYLTQKRPAIYPQVQKSLNQQLSTKILQPPQKKRGVKLPCFILAAMPGCYYEGEWKNGRPFGYGKVYAKNGLYFEGSFEGGLANCQEGILVYADGSFYRGSFKDNTFHGHGAFVYKKNGTKYVGDWVQDKPNGKGAEYYFEESRYQGDFKGGLKHGEGKYTFSDGKIYKGRFHQGQFSEGRLMQKGSRGAYEGKFEKGFKTVGSLTTQFGVYSGAFLNGLMHDPKGVFKWADGKAYYGPFEFGQMHGQGKIVSVGGQQIVGKWYRGKNVQIASIGPVMK